MQRFLKARPLAVVCQVAEECLRCIHTLQQPKDEQNPMENSIKISCAVPIAGLRSVV